MSSQFGLMKQRRFLPFFLTQFLGAFNDNVFKTALVTLVSFKAASLAGFSSTELATILPGIFILPYFLFSATSGQLADKFDKAKVIRAVKVLEIVIMAAAAWGFVNHALWLLVLALFMMGVHSTLFGPAKFAYLPQHLAESELVGGNGMVEMGTFIAILLGQVLGAAIMTFDVTGWPVAITVVGLALLGWGASLGLPASPAPDPGLRVGLNPVTETWRNIGFARKNRAVWLSLLGMSWFWFYGSTLLAQFPAFARDVLGGDEKVFILLLSVFSVGIGTGSLLCEKLSRGHVEIGLVPFAALGLTLFGADLYGAIPATPLIAHGSGISTFLAHAAHWHVLADVLLIGLSGGLYVVPLYAMVQTRADQNYQSRIMAANNIINSGFMVASALISLVLFKLGLNIAQLFLATALFNAVVALYICGLLPEFLMRFLVWIVVSTVYRVRAQGVAHIPKQGAALLVCNHVSYVDAMVILACSPRPVRFVMDRRVFVNPLLRFVFRQNKVIPIPSVGKEDAAMLERARQDIAHALAEGDLVAVFPEGRITTDGEIKPFRATVMDILAHSQVPVLPMALRGLWGSFFSRKDGPAMKKAPWRAWQARVELLIDAPVPAAQAEAGYLVERMLGLRGEMK